MTNNTSDNTAPVISGTGTTGATWYSKGEDPVALLSDPALFTPTRVAVAPTITDTTDTYLESATITITTNRQSTDVLSVVPGSLPSGIVASTYNSTTGR